jgi:hypothetical protein
VEEEAGTAVAVVEMEEEDITLTLSVKFASKLVIQPLIVGIGAICSINLL